MTFSGWQRIGYPALTGGDTPGFSCPRSNSNSESDRKIGQEEGEGGQTFETTTFKARRNEFSWDPLCFFSTCDGSNTRSQAPGPFLPL